MAQKPVKKTAAKTVAKPAAKKAPVKKVAAKKTAKTVENNVVMPAVETYDCGCAKGCACGGNCGCHGGFTFGRFIKKLIIALIIFALGFAAAKMCCGGKYGMRGPRAHFVNGCLDTASVKCPKMLEILPAMDINQDGCITREEYKAVKKELRREMRAGQAQIAE